MARVAAGEELEFAESKTEDADEGFRQNQVRNSLTFGSNYGALQRQVKGRVYQFTGEDFALTFPVRKPHKIAYSFLSFYLERRLWTFFFSSLENVSFSKFTSLGWYNVANED